MKIFVYTMNESTRMNKYMNFQGGRGIDFGKILEIFGWFFFDNFRLS